jgi:meckelin
MKALQGHAGPVHVGHHRRCFEFLCGGVGRPDVFTSRTMEIKRNINAAFQQCVHGAEKSILSKFGLHALMDFPPNVLYMNGPRSGEKEGTDLFFTDDAESYGASLMYGLDFDLFIFYMLFFLSVDSALNNTFGSMTLTYLLELLVVFYRSREGQANIGSKTLFDDRFFL